MHPPRTSGVKEGAVRSRPWQMAVAEFGQRLGSPPPPDGQGATPLEIGMIGLSGVGKSSLLNALVAPTGELLPSGGIGPLTGVPVRLFHAVTATLRVRYLGRGWLLELLTKLENAPSKLTNDEVGRLSLICTGDQYAARDPMWLAQGLRYALQPDRMTPPPCDQRTRDALRGAHDLLQREGAVREWESAVPDGVFFRRIHEHVSGANAALCERIEIGWPSAILEAGGVLVDLPGLGMVSDSYSRHTSEWLAHARAVVVIVDRAGMAESTVTCLRRSGFLDRVLMGHADLIGVMTKLDQVTEDVRRRDRSAQSWVRCFRSVALQAETELLSQIGSVLRYHQETQNPAHLGAHVRAAIRVFGVSSREHRCVLQYDPEDPPRLQIPESSGIPAVRRALIGLSRLRSTACTSDILDRVRRSPDVNMLLPQLFSLVDMEGS